MNTTEPKTKKGSKNLSPLLQPPSKEKLPTKDAPPGLVIEERKYGKVYVIGGHPNLKSRKRKA